MDGDKSLLGGAQVSIIGGGGAETTFVVDSLDMKLFAVACVNGVTRIKVIINCFLTSMLSRIDMLTQFNSKAVFHFNYCSVDVVFCCAIACFMRSYWVSNQLCRIVQNIYTNCVSTNTQVTCTGRGYLWDCGKVNEG